MCCPAVGPCRQYQADTSSSQAKGLAVNFNVAMNVFKASGSVAPHAESEEEFKQAKEFSAAYRKSVCDPSSVNSATDDSVQVLNKSVDSSVMTAYTNCLQCFLAVSGSP